MQIYSFPVYKCQYGHTCPALTSKFESAVATERLGSSKKPFKTLITARNSNQFFLKLWNLFLSCRPFPFHLPTPPAPVGHTEVSRGSGMEGVGRQWPHGCRRSKRTSPETALSPCCWKQTLGWDEEPLRAQVILGYQVHMEFSAATDVPV